MTRRLRCLVRGHDWHVQEHDHVTERTALECSRCGARRTYRTRPGNAQPGDEFGDFRGMPGG